MDVYNFLEIILKGFIIIFVEVSKGYVEGGLMKWSVWMWERL